MGIGSQAGATVRLEIIILQGKAALAMRRLDQGITRASRSVGRANRRFVRFGSVIGTISKALLSMVAVLIAFNLLITLPQRIFSAFITVLGAAGRTVSQFEQRILALQAILASTVRFAPKIELDPDFGLTQEQIDVAARLKAENIITPQITLDATADIPLQNINTPDEALVFEATVDVPIQSINTPPEPITLQAIADIPPEGVNLPQATLEVEATLQEQDLVVPQVMLDASINVSEENITTPQVMLDTLANLTEDNISLPQRPLVLDAVVENVSLPQTTTLMLEANLPAENIAVAEELVSLNAGATLLPGDINLPAEPVILSSIIESVTLPPQTMLDVAVNVPPEDVMLPQDLSIPVEIDIPDAALQNFILSGRVAAGIVEQLALRANEMVISLEEATVVFQTLVATGAQEMVKDIDELIDLTVLLGNAIAGITVGQQRQRQLAEETRSLITGQLRATSLLGRLLFSSSTEIKKFNTEMRKTRTLSAELRERLLGFALAAKDFASTFEGLTTTFQTFLQLLAKRTFSGIFLEIEKQLSDVFDQVRENQGSFNLLAANLAAAFQIIRQALTGIVTDTLGIQFQNVQDFFIRLTDLVKPATEKLLTLIFTLRNLAIFLAAVVQIGRAFIDFLAVTIRNVTKIISINIAALLQDSIITALESSLTAIGNFIGNAFDAIGNIIERKLADTIFGKIGAVAGEAVNEFLTTTGQGISNSISSIGESFGELAGSLIQAANPTNAISFLVAKIFDPFLSLFDTSISELSEKLGDSFDGVVDKLESAVGLLIQFSELADAGADATRLTAFFAELLAKEDTRIKKEALLILDANQRLARVRRLDLQTQIDINKEHLKTNRFLRQELSTLVELLRLSRTGQLSRITGINLIPNIDEAKERALESLRVLRRDLLSSEFQLGRAQLPGSTASVEQIEALEQETIKLRSAINATLADLIALDQIFIDLANTTFPQLAQAISDLALGGLFAQFAKFFQDFKDGKKDFEIDIKAILTSIKDFVTSAAFLLQVIGAIGAGIATAITNAFSGLKGFGQTLREIFGSFITLIGQAIVQLGVAAVAVGIIGAILGVPNAGALIVAGLKAIAIGTGLIALGVALSGGGGGSGAGGGGAGGEETVPTFTFDQALVNVQQSFVTATEELNQTASSIQRVAEHLTSLPAGEVVMTGNNEMGGASKVLAIDLKKGQSISSGRDIALSLRGGAS